MKMIGGTGLARAKAHVEAHARPLDRERFIHYLEKENRQQVIAALATFQNTDGGFGHGLEPDFLLPDSSAMATSVALRTLVELRAPAESDLVRQAIQYLVTTFDRSTMRWPAVPPGVNDYPHAPWWHYQDDSHGTVLDQTWGNPTAELLGCLLHYRELVPGDLLASLYPHSVDYLLRQPDEMEMHELHCFLKFSDHVETSDRRSVRDKLARLVMNTVTVDPEKWQSYSAQPLDFVASPNSFLYPPLSDPVALNLDFLVDSVSEEGIWFPNWSWGQYEQAWLQARQIIACSLTVDRWYTLKRFGRIAS